MNLSIISLLKNFDENCINSYESLYSQSSHEFEHIVIYKKLNDDKLNYLKKKFNLSNFILENENNYKNKFFALNQGIKIAKGKYVMVLHSDDMICNKNLISEINNLHNDNTEFITTGVKIINKEKKVIRKWMFSENKDLFGFSDIPPHTGFIYKRNLHKIFGLYSLDFPIASDFDFMLKFFSNKKDKKNYKIINDYSIDMSFGGDSTKLKNLVKVFFEDRLIFKRQKKNFPMIRAIYKKILKINQFL